MRINSAVVCSGVFVIALSGCSKNISNNHENTTTSVPTTRNGGTTTHQASTTVTSPRSTESPSANCPGKRLGQYSWGTNLWSNGNTEFSDFFGTQAGKDWGCGDIYINIGDYTAPKVIAHQEDLVPFIQTYRETSGNWESVVWMTYGDVESDNGTLMSIFVNTFFDWASSLSSSTADSLGPVGLSFDVEHMTPASTKSALQLAQSLKSSTNFAPGTLLIQHTIEGNPNIEGTDYVMKYADSALIMLYRNYMHSPDFKDDSNILSRAAYMLKEQCVHCLDDAYAAANYNAKWTIMIESSCSPSDYCAKISFCAHDDLGAEYAWQVVEQMEAEMFSTGLVTIDQFDRLFNPLTTYAIHDWYWFRCYSPLSDSVSYPECSSYSSAAATCRETVGPLSTTTASP